MKSIILVLSLFCYVVGYSQQAVEMDQLTKKGETYSHNGKLFTGNCYAKHPNGKIGIKGQMKEGEKEGLWIWWYSDGQKKRETTYVNGKKEGLTLYWHPNGVKAKELMYKADKNIDQKLWDEEGNRLPNPSFSQMMD